MRLSRALAALVGILAGLSAARAFMFFEDGKEYVYETRTSIEAGTMDVRSYGAGVIAKWQTRIQPVGSDRLNVKFEGVKFAEFNGLKSADPDAMDASLTFNPREGFDNIEFGINYAADGLVKHVVMSDSYPVILRNIVKGFVSQLQLDTNSISQGKKAFVSKENMLHGTCGVTYAVSSDVVKRTVAHAEDCIHHVHRFVDDIRGHVCRPDAHIHGEKTRLLADEEGEHSMEGHRLHMPHPSSIAPYPESLATVSYHLDKERGDKPSIDRIDSCGSVVAQFFTEEGRTQYVHTNTSSRLVKVKPSGADISPTGQEYDDIRYEFSDAHLRWDDTDRDLKAKEPFFASVPEYMHSDQAEIVKSVKSAIATQGKIMHKIDPNQDKSIRMAHLYGINTILPAFYALNYASLRSLADFYFSARSDDESEMNANLFAELLSTAGTTSAALLVRDLVLEKRFPNDRDAARALTGVPFHIRRPNMQLVKEYEKLLNFDGDRFVQMAIPLSFGHLVRMTCQRAGDPHSKEVRKCFQEFASTYVDRFIDEFKATNSVEKKGTLLHVLMNIRYGGVANKLRDTIYNTDDADLEPHIRSTAMWAAYYDVLTSGHGYEFFMPMLIDTKQPTELRINALVAIMYSRPTPSQLLNIVNMLHTERSYELVNMAYSLFESYANSINPCMEKLKPLVSYYLKFMKQFSTYRAFYGFGVSKTYMREFDKEKYGYGGQVMYYTVGSEQSMTPLSFGMAITNTMMKSYKVDDLAIHVRVEGLAKALVRKFKSMDPETWKTEALKSILSNEMNIRARPNQPVRVQISILMKGTAVFNRYYDDKDTKSGGKLASFFEDMKNMGDSYKINHQRAMQLNSMLYEQPTLTGMPVAIVSSTVTMMSLKAEINRGNHLGLLFRDIKYELDVFSQSSQATILPMIDATFGIVNDRIYYTRIPRAFVIGFNPILLEFRYTTVRPDAEDKMRLIMHAESSVRVRGNNVQGKYKDLQMSCPNCENYVVVARDDDGGERRKIVDYTSDKFGSKLRAEYFDCDMDVTRANTWRHGLKAMMPYNKQPRTLANTLMMGFRQIRTYFFVFPRTERCGLAVSYGQSDTNPISEIHISVRGKMESNGQRMFFRGRKWTLKAIIKLIGTPANRTYRVSTTYQFTPGYLSNVLKMRLERLEVPEMGISPYTVCLNMDNKYPSFSPEFLTYDPSTQMSVKGNFGIEYGPAADCDNPEGAIKGDFEHSTTEEAREQMKDQWYYKECEKDRSLPEWNNGKGTYPMTEACYMTLHDATTARQYTYNIKFEKLTRRMNFLLSKARAAIEAGLLPYWDMTSDVTSGGELGPFLNAKAIFRNHERTLDLTLETRQGTETIKDIGLSLPIWPRVMRNLKFQGTVKRLYDMGVISPCVMNAETIRTNDNTTYAYNLPTCWTLYSGHCSEQPSYAVFARKSQSPGAVLEAKVFVGGHEIELTGDQVKVNGNPVQIEQEQAHVEEVDNTEVFSIFRWGSTYNIYSFLKVWITYDGTVMEVMPAPSVKGQHCGLCGNYNRNRFDEFTDKNMKTSGAMTPADMVAEYKWKC